MAAVEAPDVPEEGPPLSSAGKERLAPLDRPFYARPSTVVARDLLGRLLVRSSPAPRLVGRIVETEAYRQDDPASHSFRGRTARTHVMFGPPGHLYVYFTYGMHYCMNVVTGDDGEGSAVLLRAVEPLEGLSAMAARRGVADGEPVQPTRLCSGPAMLTQAFGVTTSDDGLDLVADRLFVAAGHPLMDDQVAVGPRVGIRVATDRPWRFREAGSRFVSRGDPRPPARSDRRRGRGRR